MSKEMNLVKKLSNPEVISRISRLDWSGETDIGPYVVELDPTAACDMACPGCISEDIIAEGGRIGNEKLLGLPDEFVESGVRAVILIGGGEPLTHPKVGDFMSLCAERDIKIGITTNGTMIDRYIDEIAELSDWTRVSMDAGTQKNFDVLRPTKKGISAFHHIIENMKLLGLKKRGLMGYSYLLQSPADGENVIENLDDLYEAAKLSRDIGCDYFEVKPSYAWRGDTPHALMVHKKNYLELAKEKLAEIEELETESFHILHAINLKYSLDGVQAQQVKQYDVCPSAQLRTLITPKGVYVCPYWRGKKRFKLGDINNMRLAEIWQSENKKKVMKNLDPSRDCQFHCLRHDTNNVAIDIKKNIENMPSEENNNNSEEFDRFI